MAATPFPDPTAPSPKEAGSGFLLVNRRPVLSESFLESLTVAAAVTGLDLGDLRLRFKGQGIGVLNLHRPLPALKECAAALKDIGINAGVVSKTAIQQAPLPRPARHLALSSGSLALLDANKEPLLTITKQSRLLIILTDLSGRAVQQIMTAMAYTGGPIHKEFEEILQKISIAKPAAVFFDLDAPPETGIYVDTDTFSVIGLDEKRTHSKAGNFRIMIREAMALSASAVIDENFGIALLPGASPEWSRGKAWVERELWRYCGYILTAAHQQLLPFTPDVPAAASPDAVENGEGASGSGDFSGPHSSSGLPAPPDASESRLTALMQSSLPEILLGLIVFASPFSLFMAGVHAVGRHAVFWKGLAGFSVACAGALMCCYAFVLFYYRRMVENTPTSKIRSLSMGMVELSGRAERCYDLLSPATKTRCIYYRCRYYRYQKTGDNARWVLTRAVSSGSVPFYLADGTGRVLILPKGAVMKAPPTVQTFQGTHIPTLGFQMNDPHKKVVEEVVPEKAVLYVLGSARIQKHGRPLSTIMVDNLRMLKQNPEKLLEYDVNGDGRVDGEEWESARDDAERMAYAEALARGPEAGESVVIANPRIGLLPFIIADSEDKLVSKLLWRTLLFLVGGGVTLGFGIAYLIRYFN